MEEYITATFIMYPDRIKWVAMSDQRGNVTTGCDMLYSANGDYDSLLSNTVNKVNSLVKIDEFIFRKG